MDVSSTRSRFSGTSLNYIDYVLVYKDNSSQNEIDTINEEERKHHRNLYHCKLKKRGLYIEEIEDKDNKLTFVLIQSSFQALCSEAERLCLRMPINAKAENTNNSECFTYFEKKYLVTDVEEDFLSAPFIQSVMHIYKNFDNVDNFFRSGLRFFMTYNILINTDINEDLYNESFEFRRTKALHYLVHHKVYTEDFFPHSPSQISTYFKSLPSIPNLSENQQNDERKDLHEVWIKKWRFQPLYMIRNYFGEKSAFYFAWTGHMILYLWIPMIFGLIVFLYGLHQSVVNPSPMYISNSSDDFMKVELAVENMLNTVKHSFDNVLTPIFAVVICIWGTIFTDTWKRVSNKLSFEWDVWAFDETESERPQFVGTEERKHPVTNIHVSHFPLIKQCVRFFGSFIVLLGMLVVVFGAVIAVIVYRVVVTVNICPETTSTNCLLLNMVISSVMNAFSIIVLGKVYEKVAYILTDWENHRTQSSYDNALIFKLFTFQFVNSYTSLFYIAFFKGQSSGIQKGDIFHMGYRYTDTCGNDNNCMSMLSFQVLILMIIKPIPKFCIDVIIPFFIFRMKIWKEAKSVKPNEDTKHSINIKNYLLHEMAKPVVGDFTISEYMEKVILYGYIVLFAASFPLAPLFAFLANCMDNKIGGYRLLWIYRRPVPEVVENIGIWQSIVEALNLLGVVSTAFIIAFTSSWGQSLSLQNKLIFIIALEHGLLFLRYTINSLISEVPMSVVINRRREKFHLNKMKEEIIKNKI